MGYDDSLLLHSPSVIWSPILRYQNPVISIVLCRSTWACWRCTVWGVKHVPASSLFSVTWVFGEEKHSNFRHVPPVVIEVSNLHMPDLNSVSHHLSKLGGGVSYYLSLSCFSCLNSSADSSPMCFCTAGYTGNGTHCTGMSSKCGQDSRLAHMYWSYAKTRVLFVK